ncbi:MAG: cobalamin-dependent protein [Proteobacteria bacterium]|nr:cobalamin-dependent protein [Pseudomonadota bacterium]
MTARCLLVSANRMVSPYPVYPIGIAYIMGALQGYGHRADHVDILASGGYSALLKKLGDTHYDIIGISIRNIDTVDSASPQEMLTDITEAIQHIRQHTKAPIVLGGPGFSIMPEQLLDYCKGDYGIVGEGEEAFPQLIDRIMSGEHPEQKLFSKSLTSFPECQPSYSHEVTPYYVAHGGMLNVQTKRGCNYGCAYCSYPTIEGQKLRYRDTAEVVSEIERLCREFGARYIFFTDAVFNDPHDHYLQIAEELIRKENTTPWCAFFRPQNLTKDTLRLLKRSGMVAMELGTDASTNTTLTALNKGFTFDEVLAVNEAIVAESLACAHFLMFGGPGETRDTVLQGIRNLKKLRRSVVFAYIGIRILPGTKVHKRAFVEQLIADDTDLVMPIFYYSPMVDRDFIESRLLSAFHGRKDRIFPVAKSEHLIPLLHKMGHMGPLWDLLIDKT